MSAQQINQAKRQLKRAIKDRQQEIADAIKGLQEEDENLSSELAALDGTAPAQEASPSISKPRRRRRRGKAKGARKSATKAPGSAAAASSKSSTKPAPRKRRSRRGGTRAEQTLKLLQANPGQGGKELAEQMKVKPNYIYRVLDDLKKDGKAEKRDRKWYPVA